MKRRRRIGVDCDGVFANFVAFMAKEITSHLRAFGVDNIEIVEADITTYEIFTSPKIAPLVERFPSLPKLCWNAPKARGVCFNLLPYDSAHEGMKILHDLGDVYIVTTPFHDAERWHAEREAWLMQHFGVHHHHVIHMEKKLLVGLDVFIDDKPSHIQQWREEYPQGLGILWVTSQNQHVESEFKTNDWHEVKRCIELFVPPEVEKGWVRRS